MVKSNGQRQGIACSPAKERAPAVDSHHVVARASGSNLGLWKHPYSKLGIRKFIEVVHRDDET